MVVKIIKFIVQASQPCEARTTRQRLAQEVTQQAQVGDPFQEITAAMWKMLAQKKCFLIVLITTQMKNKITMMWTCSFIYSSVLLAKKMMFQLLCEVINVPFI